MSKRTWYNLNQKERQHILALPEDNHYRQRMLATMRGIEEPKEQESEIQLTRKLKEKRHPNKGGHVKSVGFNKTALSVNRDKYIHDTRAVQPDLIPRKAEKSYPFSGALGRVAPTVDGTPLALVETSKKDHYRDLSDLHTRAERIRMQERQRYLRNMPSSDW